MNPQESPWGRVQFSHTFAEGIVFVETASHGGFWLSSERMAAFLKRFPRFRTFAGGAWFEEDCDAFAVIAHFPEFFSKKEVQQAKRMIQAFAKTWPDKWTSMATAA